MSFRSRGEFGLAIKVPRVKVEDFFLGIKALQVMVEDFVLVRSQLSGSGLHLLSSCPSGSGSFFLSRVKVLWVEFKVFSLEARVLRVEVEDLSFRVESGSRFGIEDKSFLVEFKIAGLEFHRPWFPVSRAWGNSVFGSGPEKNTLKISKQGIADHYCRP